jgi:hypothetical protein
LFLAYNARMKKLNNTFGRTPEEAAQIIYALGGNTVIGVALEITPQAISYWRRKGIPRPWLQLLRAKYPSAFPKRTKAAAAPTAPTP